jgi:flavin-binding protein dodecin
MSLNTEDEGSSVPVQRKEGGVADSVYKVIELIGTSTESWGKAAEAAVERASKTIRDLRIAEVVEMDMQLEEGKVARYRTKIRVSFKYHGAEAWWEEDRL